MGSLKGVEALAAGLVAMQGQREAMIHPVARPPDRLEIGDRATAGEMPLGLDRVIADHFGQHGDRLVLNHAANPRHFA